MQVDPNTIFNSHFEKMKLEIEANSVHSPELIEKITIQCRLCFKQLEKQLQDIERNIDNFTSVTATNLLTIKTHYQLIQEILNPELYPKLQSLDFEGQFIDQKIGILYQKMVTRLSEWEIKPQQCALKLTQQRVIKYFQSIINFASAQGWNDQVQALEKQRSIVLSHYQQSHFLRDRMVELRYNVENVRLYRIIRDYLFNSLPIGELLFNLAENLKAEEFLLPDIEQLISSLNQSCSTGVWIEIGKEEEEEEISIEALFYESLKYLNRYLVENKKISDPTKLRANLREKWKSLTSQLSKLEKEDVYPIIKHINEPWVSKLSQEACEEILFSKIKTREDIKHELIKKTADENTYHLLFNQPWNSSTWPKECRERCVPYHYYLNKFLDHFSPQNSMELTEKIEKLPEQVKASLSLFFAKINKSPFQIEKNFQFLVECHT